MRLLTWLSEIFNLLDPCYNYRGGGYGTKDGKVKAIKGARAKGGGGAATEEAPANAMMDGAEKANPSEAKLGGIKSQSDFEDLALQHIEQIRLELAPESSKGDAISIADLRSRMKSEHGISDAQFTSQLREAMLNDKIQLGTEKNLRANSKDDFNIGGLTRSSVKDLGSPTTNRVQSAMAARRGRKTGEVINSQDNFNKSISSIISRTPKGETIPIHKIRAEIGDRVTPAQFNKWLVGGLSTNRYDLRTGAHDRDKSNAKGGVTIPGGDARFMLTVR